MRDHHHCLLVRSTAVLALVALVVPGCATADPPQRTEVADATVSATDLDPAVLLSSISRSSVRGWEVIGEGAPVPVSIEDIRLSDPDRADHYVEAGFEAGARLSLARGETDRIAVMADRFPHPAAARQVQDWYLATSGGTLEDGVSRVGATAEGVLVLEDMLVRVVAVGAEAPDEAAVRGLLDAVREVVRPRA